MMVGLSISSELRLLKITMVVAQGRSKSKLQKAGRNSDIIQAIQPIGRHPGSGGTASQETYDGASRALMVFDLRSPPPSGLAL
jgi:hypothetical protein